MSHGRAGAERRDRRGRSFFARPRIVPPPIVSSRSRRASHRRRRAPRVARISLLLGRLYVRLRLVGILGDLVAPARARRRATSSSPRRARSPPRIVRPGPGFRRLRFPRHRGGGGRGRRRAPRPPPRARRPQAPVLRHHPSRRDRRARHPRPRRQTLRPRQLGRDPGGARGRRGRLRAQMRRRARRRGADGATRKARNALFAAAAEPALIFDDPDAAKTAIDAKVRECTENSSRAAPNFSDHFRTTRSTRRRGASTRRGSASRRRSTATRDSDPSSRRSNASAPGSNPPAGYSRAAWENCARSR